MVPLSGPLNILDLLADPHHLGLPPALGFLDLLLGYLHASGDGYLQFLTGFFLAADPAT
jgi:hypothetical protein